MFELTIFPTLLFALTIDAIIGDPKLFYRTIPHPAQMMGWIINHLDTWLNDESDEPRSKRIKGVSTVIIIFWVFTPQRLVIPQCCTVCMRALLLVYLHKNEVLLRYY